MTSKVILLFCTAAAFCLCGCSGPAEPASTRIAVVTPESRTPHAVSQLSTATVSSDTIIEPVGDLTLQTALALALLHNPQLKSSALDIRIAEADRLQASLPPNPELEFEAEEVGAGSRAALRPGDTIIALSQLVELGGKRQKRTTVGNLETQLAAMDYEARRLDVLSEVHTRFVDLLAAQRQLELMTRLEHLAGEALEIVEAQVEGGRDSHLETKRAKIQVSEVRMQRIAAERDLDVARKTLAALWSADEPQFDKAAGNLDATHRIAPLETLRTRMDNNPDLARWSVEMEQRRAAIALEKARAIPDVTLGGGIQFLDENSQTAAVFGARVALPLFDANQGGRRAAAHRLARANLDAEAARITIATGLAKAHRDSANALTRVEELKHCVLQNAQEVFEAVEQGYRSGKFAYIDLLDSQRTLFEVQLQYVAALTDYHKARAELERLIGGPATDDQIQTNEN